MDPLIHVRKVTDRDDLETVFKIRREVFVDGQNVPWQEEFDEFEKESHHFLATCNEHPAGAARWRFTDKGIKLERFAVLDKYQSRGIGSALVEAVEKDILSHAEFKPGTRLFMHSQVTAIGLYRKYNYQKRGDLFLECDIEHFLMEKII